MVFAWGRSDIGGDPIVVVLSEAVSDAHLAACTAKACPTFSPVSRSSLWTSRWTSSIATSA
jgi:hypothetical protein